MDVLFCISLLSHYIHCAVKFSHVNVPAGLFVVIVTTYNNTTLSSASWARIIELFLKENYQGHVGLAANV